MTRDISRLIEAINRVGIQNISLLSRMSGMPVETVRYTVKKRFPSLGLKVRTPVNYNVMGLERYFIALNLSNDARSSAKSLFDSLSSTAFLTYYCKNATDARYLSFFAVPVTVVDGFRGFLDLLVEQGVLLDYRMERLEWCRHPELRSTFYDFAKGAWVIDWDQLSKGRETPPAIPAIEEPSGSPEIDSTDNLIIKELELDSWRNIAEIARKLKINERTLRWHYAKHVAPTALSSYVHWMPVAKKEWGKAGGLVYEFQSVPSRALDELRRVFNNFPFAWFEAGRKDGYYQVHAAVPAGSLMESMRFLGESLEGVADAWRVWTTDLSTSSMYTIPYENYKDESGWFFDSQAALAQVLPRGVKIEEQRRT